MLEGVVILFYCTGTAHSVFAAMSIYNKRLLTVKIDTGMRVLVDFDTTAGTLTTTT